MLATVRGLDLAIHAHPWDLRALQRHGGLARLRDLGFVEVALAVSYHAGRWLAPWHPDGMVRFLEDGTVHYRPRGEHGRLRPQPSSEVPATGPSPLEWLCEQAPRAGLRARAWAVCTHNTRLGELHPDCCVENAFGDRYPYALCPAQPAVQQYIHEVVRDLAAHQGLAAIELESFGWQGHRHNSHHDKASFAPDPVTDRLLSTCFCVACRDGMQSLQRPGVAADIGALRARVQQLLRRFLTEGDALAPPRHDPGAAQRLLLAELGEPALAAISGHRLRVVRELWQRTAAACGPAPLLALQSAYDALHGEPQVPLHAADRCAEFVLTCYGEGPDRIARALPQLAAVRQPGQQRSLRLCIHPRAPQFTGDDDLRRVRDLCAQHAIASLAVYHLGLLPWRTIERVAAVLRT